MIITLEAIHKYHNEKCILKDVSYAIEEKSKIALIGNNGVGKSTLLAILAGLETYDQGVIMRKRDCRIAYLSQSPELADEHTVLEEVMADADQDSEEYEAKAILGKLGIHEYDAQIPILSGGQRKRVALAKVLLQESDLLLLDEPTNHLDAEMIEWLEGYLIKSNRALFMVTHDRYFMERITNEIVELDHGNLYRYHGNYETYIEAKQLRNEQAAQQSAKRRSLLRKELEWVRAGVQARGTKDKGRLARFEKLSSEEGSAADTQLKVTAQSARLGKKTLEINKLGKAYGSHTLFDDFSYQVKHKERIGILGRNGCGKSTLLKILHGDISADHGSVIYGETVKLAYFAQGNEAMNPDQRVIDFITDISDDIETKEGHRSAAQMLEQFLFDRNVQYQKISTLSGGEKRRLYLLSILMRAPNILLLDEPTNDLDITTLQILEDYLDDFAGIVIVVSHDRYFLDRICDTMWIFQNGTIQTTIGGYSRYRSIQADTSITERQTNQKTNEERRHLPSMSSKEKKEWETIEQDMAALEQRILETEQAMAGFGDDFHKLQELSEQRDTLEKALELKTERWMELEEKRAMIAAAKQKR